MLWVNILHLCDFVEVKYSNALVYFYSEDIIICENRLFIILHAKQCSCNWICVMIFM
jgi:hypothetical protein